MSVIENFAALSAQEQREFANSLIKTINSENIFSSDVAFEIINVEADDISGGLMIEVSHTPHPIEVSRNAIWTCGTAEDAEDDPGFEANYENSVYEDMKKAFKTLSQVVEGYRVSLDISDIDEDETVEVTANQINHEDSGVGAYEFWGDRGYDSRPYCEVEGTIVRECEALLTFFVEPADEYVETLPEETEEN